MLMTPEPTSDPRPNGRNGNNNIGHVTGQGNESGNGTSVLKADSAGVWLSKVRRLPMTTTTCMKQSPTDVQLGIQKPISDHSSVRNIAA
jgi:hypothetical protein